MVYGANVLANWLYSLEVFHTFHGKQPSFLYQRFSIGLSIVHFNNFKRIERTIHSSFQDKTAFSRTKRHFRNKTEALLCLSIYVQRALRWCWKVLNGSGITYRNVLRLFSFFWWAEWPWTVSTEHFKRPKKCSIVLLGAHFMRNKFEKFLMQRHTLASYIGNAVFSQE